MPPLSLQMYCSWTPRAGVPLVAWHIPKSGYRRSPCNYLPRGGNFNDAALSQPTDRLSSFDLVGEVVAYSNEPSIDLLAEKTMFIANFRRLTTYQELQSRKSEKRITTSPQVPRNRDHLHCITIVVRRYKRTVGWFVPDRPSRTICEWKLYISDEW